MSETAAQVREALAWLERKGSAKVKKQMLEQFGIVAPKSFGVPISPIQQLAKKLGKDHALAQALFDTGWYEARLLAAYVDEPTKVTSAQMDRWVREFDNWGVVDTLCFVLFDKTKAGWSKVEPWCKRKEEFVRRSGFVMLACLGLHDKTAPDAKFVKGLGLIETYATDERNFVRKGISWALRVIGMRNTALNAAALKSCERMIASGNPVARSIGMQGARELKAPKVQQLLAKRSAKKKSARK